MTWTKEAAGEVVVVKNLKVKKKIRSTCKIDAKYRLCFMATITIEQ